MLKCNADSSKNPTAVQKPKQEFIIHHLHRIQSNHPQLVIIKEALFVGFKYCEECGWWFSWLVTAVMGFFHWFCWLDQHLRWTDHSFYFLPAVEKEKHVSGRQKNKMEMKSPTQICIKHKINYV